jgi:DNA-binding CsgD family transcriptional regulator
MLQSFLLEVKVMVHHVFAIENTRKSAAPCEYTQTGVPGELKLLTISASLCYHTRQMDDLTPDKPTQHPRPPSAFIFYRPAQKKAKENIFYNDEAWRVLTFANPALKEMKDCTEEISLLCTRWKKLTDERLRGQAQEPEERTTEAGTYIDLMQSHRRRYGVRGIILSNQLLDSQEKGKQYLFILERAPAESVNLSMIFRQKKLNNREQDIVRLLLAGRSNKEIADALGLSLNTVKGYLKLLMRKLGVGSRAEIIAVLLTK